ncbi:MAG: PQQ-binding-like beta-propeller repeat protein [Opitutaceae bacterium]
MKLVRLSLFTAALLAHTAIVPAGSAATDWPAWRGPTADGHAAPGQVPPVKWSEKENIAWRAPVRGRGHSSPTVAGDRVFLATADADTQEHLVLAFDRATGKTVWTTTVHRGPLESGNHKNSSAASSTVAWDGERLYINFLHAKAIHTSALDRDGKILWQTRVGDYVVHQGFGASPVVYEDVVIVAADHRGGGKVAGLDRRTGKILWEHARPKIPNYATPAVLRVAGRTQMILGGCNHVLSLDPLTGKQLWEIEGSTEETVVTATTDGSRVFLSGGYPKSHFIAVEADGSGKITWQNNSRVYVPTALVDSGHVFAVLDAGHAVCWDAATGKERWREKVDRDFYSSPVMAGPRVYATSLRGVTSVFEATPKAFKLLAQNQLGDEALSTPAIAGGQIFLRSAKKGEPRQEFLWCVAAK